MPIWNNGRYYEVLPLSARLIANDRTRYITEREEQYSNAIFRNLPGWEYDHSFWRNSENSNTNIKLASVENIDITNIPANFYNSGVDGKKSLELEEINFETERGQLGWYPGVSRGGYYVNNRHFFLHGSESCFSINWETLERLDYIDPSIRSSASTLQVPFRPVYGLPISVAYLVRNSTDLSVDYGERFEKVSRFTRITRNGVESPNEIDTSLNEFQLLSTDSEPVRNIGLTERNFRGPPQSDFSELMNYILEEWPDGNVPTGFTAVVPKDRIDLQNPPADTLNNTHFIFIAEAPEPTWDVIFSRKDIFRRRVPTPDTPQDGDYYIETRYKTPHIEHLPELRADPDYWDARNRAIGFTFFIRVKVPADKNLGRDAVGGKTDFGTISYRKEKPFKVLTNKVVERDYVDTVLTMRSEPSRSGVYYFLPEFPVKSGSLEVSIDGTLCPIVQSLEFYTQRNPITFDFEVVEWDALGIPNSQMVGLGIFANPNDHPGAFDSHGRFIFVAGWTYTFDQTRESHGIIDGAGNDNSYPLAISLTQGGNWPERANMPGGGGQIYENPGLKYFIDDVEQLSAAEYKANFTAATSNRYITFTVPEDITVFYLFVNQADSNDPNKFSLYDMRLFRHFVGFDITPILACEVNPQFGTVRFGRSSPALPSHQPNSVSVITASYVAVPFVRYDKVGNRPLFDDRREDLDPLRNSLSQGFLVLDNKRQLPYKLRLSTATADQVEPCIFGPLMVPPVDEEDFSLIRARVEDIAGQPIPNTCVRFESIDGMVSFTQDSGVTDGDGYVYTEIFGKSQIELFQFVVDLWEPWDINIPLPEGPRAPGETTFDRTVHFRRADGGLRDPLPGEEEQLEIPGWNLTPRMEPVIFDYDPNTLPGNNSYLWSPELQFPWRHHIRTAGEQYSLDASLEDYTTKDGKFDYAFKTGLGGLSWTNNAILVDESASFNPDELEDMALFIVTVPRVSTINQKELLYTAIGREMRVFSDPNADGLNNDQSSFNFYNDNNEDYLPQAFEHAHDVSVRQTALYGRPDPNPPVPYNPVTRSGGVSTIWHSSLHSWTEVVGNAVAHTGDYQDGVAGAFHPHWLQHRSHYVVRPIASHKNFRPGKTLIIFDRALPVPFSRRHAGGLYDPTHRLAGLPPLVVQFKLLIDRTTRIRALTCEEPDLTSNILQYRLKLNSTMRGQFQIVDPNDQGTPYGYTETDGSRIDSATFLALSAPLVMELLEPSLYRVWELDQNETYEEGRWRDVDPGNGTVEPDGTVWSPPGLTMDSTTIEEALGIPAGKTNRWDITTAGDGAEWTRREFREIEKVVDSEAYNITLDAGDPSRDVVIATGVFGLYRGMYGIQWWKGFEEHANRVIGVRPDGYSVREIEEVISHVNNLSAEQRLNLPWTSGGLNEPLKQNVFLIRVDSSTNRISKVLKIPYFDEETQTSHVKWWTGDESYEVSQEDQINSHLNNNNDILKPFHYSHLMLVRITREMITAISSDGDTGLANQALEAVGLAPNRYFLSLGGFHPGDWLKDSPLEERRKHRKYIGDQRRSSIEINFTLL